MIDSINKYLLENFGLVGIVIIILALAVMFLANYIFRSHRDDKKQWSDERKEWRDSLDKNTTALDSVKVAINESKNVSIVLTELVKTIVRRTE